MTKAETFDPGDDVKAIIDVDVIISVLRLGIFLSCALRVCMKSEQTKEN